MKKHLSIFGFIPFSYPKNFYQKEKKILNSFDLEFLKSGGSLSIFNTDSKQPAKLLIVKRVFLFSSTGFGSKPPPKTIFQCNICGKEYNLRGHLKDHIHVHLGVKPHKCSVCRRGFAWMHNLDRHLKVRTGLCIMVRKIWLVLYVLLSFP